MILDLLLLKDLAGRYLERQGWFAEVTEGSAAPLELLADTELVLGEPGLRRLVLEKGPRRFQVFVGTRVPTALAGTLRNEAAALLGTAESDDGAVVLYDALADDTCCRLLLEVASGGVEHAERVRRVASLASHSSLVYDERLFMKLYRVLEPGERLEAEVLVGLDRVGFNALVAPVARWRDYGNDLALVREFLPSALEGRLLARTSLRDLLAYVHESDDAEQLAEAEQYVADEIAASAGGDIASEFVRLGQTSAMLHLSMAEAFGERELDKPTVLDTLGDAVARWIGANLDDAASLGLGRAIRLHGDYHLRRVMRSDAGWLVAGFGDDPLYRAVAGRAPSLRAVRGSPLEDVADMYFAIGEVAGESVSLRPRGEQPLARVLAAAWIRRNRAAFLRGYLSIEAVERLLPGDPAIRDELLGAHLALREQR